MKQSKGATGGGEIKRRNRKKMWRKTKKGKKMVQEQRGEEKNERQGRKK